MPDVKQVHLLAPLQDAVYHPIDVGLVAVEQMPEISILGGNRAPVGMFFQAEDGLFEAPVPFQGGIRVLGVDFVVKLRGAAGEFGLGFARRVQAFHATSGVDRQRMADGGEKSSTDKELINVMPM